MSRLARVSFVFLLIAMLGLVACERSKADVVDTTPTTETALGTGQNGGEEEPSGEDGEDFGISTATPEATQPAETAEPGPTTVTIGEGEGDGEGEADQPTATPEEGAQAGATATPSDSEGEEAAAPTATSEPTTAPTTTEERIHVVQRGEWVYSIARQYPGVSPQDIIDANNLQSPNTVYVGQELVIPGASSDDSGDSSGQRTHVVQRGETLTGIARQYGTTVSALRSANNLSGDRIYAGQTLTIP